MSAFMRSPALQILLIMMALTPALYTHIGPRTNITPSLITPSVLSGDFTWNPSFLLAGGNISFTASPTGGSPPYQLVWVFGDGSSNSSSHPGSSGAFYLNATQSSSSHQTTSSVDCASGSVTVNSPSTCKVTVRDLSTSPTSPSGTVSFASTGIGTFTPALGCSLTPGPGLGNATCTVNYTPTATGSGTHTIIGTYPGDAGHVGVSSGKFTLYVTTATLLHSTTTSVSCNPGSLSLGNVTICTATVRDTSSNPTTPTGTIDFTSDSPGSFKSSPAQCDISPGTFTGTASCTIRYQPSSVGSGTHTINATYSGNNDVQVTHVYNIGGNYPASLTITDSASATFFVTHTITVQGSPIILDGWTVNWNISAHRGIEIYSVTHNSKPTIRDGLLDGILVRYKNIPTPPYLLSFCLFYDQLDNDDLNTTVAGFSLQFGSVGSDSYFQIRANYNPAQVGYNYTEIWRFYTSGRFDAELAVSHLGCGRDHIYEPHWRIALTVGNPTNDLMSQYTTGGVWKNLVWEGNYTDTGARDPNNHGAQWRIGDGTSWYYMAPTASVWASDLPYIPPKIYLVRDHPNETERTILPDNPNIDPIIFANGELAYRQQLAFWFLPDYWDHWIGLTDTFLYPGSEVTLSFYPYNI